MYQFSVQVQNDDRGFAGALDDLKRRLSSVPNDRVLFHIYSTVFSVQTVSDLILALYDKFSGCQIVCCTVSGGVLEHEYQQGVVIAAEVFEHRDSRAEVRYYDLADGTDKETAGGIVKFVKDNPWVKAVEIYRTIHDMNTTEFCGILSELPEDIVVFGGLASSEQIPGNLSYIADKSGRLTDKGVIAVYYGGSDLHIKVCKMSGWKPIDKPFTVTKSDKNVILEIDGAPANEIYRRYLDIEPDDYFVMNALEFPMISRVQSHSVVRNVFSIDPRGGITVAYDVDVGTELKISYADAESVIEDIHAVSRELMQFTPDVVSVVSCITRSMIWRMKDYMPELQGFKQVAPCHGYLSHGELLREDGILSHHNTTLIAAAFREGGSKDIAYPDDITVNAASTIPLAARLSTFISRVTDELKNMYSEVEQAATTDALTSIGNRYMFDDVVRSVSDYTAHANTKYLMMFDLNGLKTVNDTFGHSQGDVLIKTAAETISNSFSQYGQCFRIGGDEFAVIADFESEAELKSALDGFYAVLREYNKSSHFNLSMAVGYAALVNDQGKRLSDSEWKMTADINMYRDKKKYHVIKPELLNQSMSEFISRIMSLLDNKNLTSAYHSVRVQRMSVMIAKMMGLDDDVVDKVNLGAYLHDIGMIGISDMILTKTEKLSEEERSLLHRKPIIARRLLSMTEDTKVVANIVYACYEWWDGSGYPEGISGEDIPLEARIIAVADYIDTVLHDGYGKTAFTEEECVGMLRKNSASRFDPAVVSIVLPHFNDIVNGDADA